METLRVAKKVLLIAFVAVLTVPGIAFSKPGVIAKVSYFYNDSSSSLIKIFPSSHGVAKKTVLTFTVKTASKVSIKIYDVEGREIAYLIDKNVPAGTFELYLETKNLRKGMYYCKFFTGEKVAMKKMITVSQ